MLLLISSMFTFNSIKYGNILFNITCSQVINPLILWRLHNIIYYIHYIIVTSIVIVKYYVITGMNEAQTCENKSHIAQTLVL